MLAPVTFTAIDCRTGAERELCGKRASSKTNRFDGFRDFPYPLLTTKILTDMQASEIPEIGSWFCLEGESYRLYDFALSAKSCLTTLTLLKPVYPCFSVCSVVDYTIQEKCSDLPEAEVVADSVTFHFSNQKYRDSEDEGRSGLVRKYRAYMLNYAPVDWTGSSWIVDHENEKTFHVEEVDDLSRIDRIPYLGVKEREAPWISRSFSGAS